MSVASLDEIERDWTLDQVDLANRTLDAFEVAQHKAREAARKGSEH